MSAVTLKNVKKSYENGPQIIKGVDLQINDGEMIVFVGPSGCGKSTLLRMIAGLEDITSGELYIGKKLSNDIDPAQRKVAMVFQNYALYPHKTVFENIAFNLKLSGKSKEEMTKSVSQVAEILQISHLLQRKPHALSGGQRQRVAIGRAIVRDPQVFLFDEPLSNLDASLRVQMRIELAKLHKNLGTTMIYVTHDQVEAMTLADRIVIFNGGVIEQVGTPLELYKNPANLFVASFLGAPAINLMTVQCVAQGQAEIILQMTDGNKLMLPIDLRESVVGKNLTLGIRPEDIRLSSSTVDIELRVPFDISEHLGDHQLAYFKVPGASRDWSVKLPASTRTPSANESVPLQLPPECCHLFDDSGASLNSSCLVKSEPTKC